MKITEKLIQFVWQHQLLNTSNLKTYANNSVVILHQGVLNTKSGPDFAQAKILLGDTLFFGSIEIHINESEWYSHNHHKDPLYNTVILHVCLFPGKVATLNDGTRVPTVYIADRLNEQLMQRHEHMMLNQSVIPCADSIHHHYLRIKANWFETLVKEKLNSRCNWFTSQFNRTAYNWSETLYTAILKVLAAHTNAMAFEEIAIKLPLRLLIKHKENLNQLDALLLGVAGCIPLGKKDSMLRAEFNYLRTLYNLEPISTIIKSSGVRPTAHPVIRLKMFASMIHHNSELINQISELSTYKQLKELLVYPKEGKMFRASEQLTTLILINAVIPFQYFKNKTTASNTDTFLSFLHSLKAESNAILEKLKKINISAENCFESQAILHLYKTYCIFKRCLDCQFGIECLKHFD